MPDLKDGARALEELSERLRASGDVPEAFARRLLDQAQRRAAGHPTPQARMAAQGLGIEGGTILSLSGGSPGAVAIGSEFGSTIYRQFAPRNEGGYWLMPSANNPESQVAAVQDNWVDEAIDAAIRTAHAR